MRLADGDEVTDHEHVGEVGDGRVRVAVDGDDRRGGLHADLVLDRAADAHREVELRLDDLAGLADLLAVRDPARVDRGSRRAHGAAQGRGELLDEPEPVGAADAAATGHDDPGVIDRRGGALGLDAVDDRDRGLRQLPGGGDGLDLPGARRPARR